MPLWHRFVGQYFKQAETFFFKAKEEFVSPRDKQRQNVYLFHLYFDWARQEERYWAQVKRFLKAIKTALQFETFLNNPTRETAKYKQFVLHAHLKYLWERGTAADWQRAVSQFSIVNLQDWFEKAEKEHPFELIYMYLGCMAQKLGFAEQAETYFQRAVCIPEDSANLQIMLLPIWAQVHCRAALQVLQTNSSLAPKHLKKARQLLNQMKQKRAYSVV